MNVLEPVLLEQALAHSLTGVSATAIVSHDCQDLCSLLFIVCMRWFNMYKVKHTHISFSSLHIQIVAWISGTLQVEGKFQNLPWFRLRYLQGKGNVKLMLVEFTRLRPTR